MNDGLILSGANADRPFCLTETHIVDDRSFEAMLLFVEHVLVQVSIRLSVALSVTQLELKEIHDRILEDDEIEQGHYDWGRIYSVIDDRRNKSQINIIYSN